MGASILVPLILAAALRGAAGACQGFGIMDEVVQAMRMAHGVANLTTSASLSLSAQSKADSVANSLTTCAAPLNPALNGINIGVSPDYGVSVDPECASMYSAWLVGEALYQFTSTPYTSNQPSMLLLSPWVQTIWKATNSYGCATSTGTAKCSVLVCMFDTIPDKTDAAFKTNVLPLGYGIFPPIPPSNAPPFGGFPPLPSNFPPINFPPFNFPPINFPPLNIPPVSPFPSFSPVPPVSPFPSSGPMPPMPAYAPDEPPSPPRPPMSPPPPPVAGCTDSDEMLLTINVERGLHYAVPLTWNTSLANSSQATATSLLSMVDLTAGECSMPPNTTLPPGMIAYVSESYEEGTCLVAVGGWLAQEDAYNYTAPWDVNMQYLPDFAGFAQMIWANSSVVGCGADSFTVSSEFGLNLTCQAVVCTFTPPGLQNNSQAWADNVIPYQDPAVNVTANTTCSDPSSLVTSLNTLRLVHIAQPMTWNDSLSTVAKARATELVANATTTCDLAKSNITAMAGESIYMTSWPTLLGTSPLCLLALADWASSDPYIFNTSTPWTTNNATYAQWASSIQVIWADSRQIGCEAAIGTSSSVLTGACTAIVCKYSAAGNTPQTNAAYLANVHDSIGSSNTTTTTVTTRRSMRTSPRRRARNSA